jgi:hypothetical protein
MTQKQNSKPYDIENRTFAFGLIAIGFVKHFPATIANNEGGSQYRGTVSRVLALHMVEKRNFLRYLSLYGRWAYAAQARRA